MPNKIPYRVKNVLVTYQERVKEFSPNARLYLFNVVCSGAAMGIYRLLFNFYVLSLGYDQSFLGNLITASNLTALLAALPMGYLADYLGRKLSLILGGLSVTLAIFLMLLYPFPWVFIAMNVVMGLGQSLAGVTMGPFLMENSRERERTYLFSLGAGLQMTSAFAGNWIGGYMPTWMGIWQGIGFTSPGAYGWSLAAVGLAAMLAVAPLLFLVTPRLTAGQRSLFLPFAYFRKNPSLLGKLILPILMTSIGAGLFMPFMNVFFRQVHHQTDALIGTTFAFGSLAMGIGLMIAPSLAERVGKIRLVVITQALSIPFLFALGFSPWFAVSAMVYYFRLGLMNMSAPVYQTFVMEHVDPQARATVASLVNMAGSFGWAFSPTISGWIQVEYGFKPVFLCVVVLYIFSTFFYWNFFWRGRKVIVPAHSSEV